MNAPALSPLYGRADLAAMRVFDLLAAECLKKNPACQPFIDAVRPHAEGAAKKHLPKFNFAPRGKRSRQK